MMPLFVSLLIDLLLCTIEHDDHIDVQSHNNYIETANGN